MREIKISIIAEPDDCEPDDPGVYMDTAAIAAVNAMRDEHGLWGWCSVTVRASYGPFCGEANLGACSYEDEDAFRQGGYLPQMQAEAVEELKKEVAQAAIAIDEFQSALDRFPVPGDS